MRVVVAPDKFKGSLTAAEVARSLAEGLLSAAPDADVVQLPIADGGDGTVAAALAAGYDEVFLEAAGPTGIRGPVSYARRAGRAVIELASVCGLARLPARRADPLNASSFGLGEVLAHAVDSGVAQVVVGLGGSASTDGGAGFLQALGARLTDSRGCPVPRGGGALIDVARVDLSEVRRRLGTTSVLVASDVDSPLLGRRGAAAVFGPQKGADPEQVTVLETGLAHWALLVADQLGEGFAKAPGAGAAGGVGFAALAALGATLRPGVEVVLELVDFPAALKRTDLVITGEGSLDRQSLAGKAPLGVARAAGRAGVPVVAVVGRAELTEEEVAASGFAAIYPLSAIEPDPNRSLTDAANLLRRVGATIGRHLP